MYSKVCKTFKTNYYTKQTTERIIRKTDKKINFDFISYQYFFIFKIIKMKNN